MFHSKGLPEVWESNGIVETSILHLVVVSAALKAEVCRYTGNIK
jgi:hypothetical protein